MSDEKVVPDNEVRWNKHDFFLGGASTRPTLSEARNEGGVSGFDLTDRQLAAEILNRADLVERVFYPELLDAITEALSFVADTRIFTNPLWNQRNKKAPVKRTVTTK